MTRSRVLDVQKIGSQLVTNGESTLDAHRVSTEITLTLICDILY